MNAIVKVNEKFCEKNATENNLIIRNEAIRNMLC